MSSEMYSTWSGEEGGVELCKEHTHTYMVNYSCIFKFTYVSIDRCACLCISTETQHVPVHSMYHESIHSITIIQPIRK